MANEWISGGSFDGQWGQRARNAKSEYFDGDNLKAGYSTRFLGNGENTDMQGALAVYTNDYDPLWDSYEPMRDRANYGIFKSTGGGNSNSAEEGETPSGFPRNTGEFDDIIGALGDDVAAANARADEYADKATQDIADNTQVLSDQFNTRLAELTSGFTKRYGALEDLLSTQQNSMAQFQTMMQGQMQAAQNSYNQQVSMMQNMQRARVPEAEQNAFSAQIGDQREDTSRQKENNRLSDLSILSGLGTQASPTAGLSLA